MALDGLVVSSLVYEFQNKLIGGRIYKIYQPEIDELMIIIKNQKENYKLLLSAGASLPLAYLSHETKENPMTAPNFCMLLRKHINNGRIVKITQPNFERIINFEIEHLNEMGDLCTKTLTIEIMGKHSNIIFCNKDTIVDSIKHISYQISSVREVLPGKKYILPPSQNKLNPLLIQDFHEFNHSLSTSEMCISKALYIVFTGISPSISNEICYRASIHPNSNYQDLNPDEKNAIYNGFIKLFHQIKNSEFLPTIVYKENEPIEFSCIELTNYTSLQTKNYDSISQVLEDFYSEKNAITRIKQRSTDLRKIIQNNLERSSKKYSLQLKQLSDTEKRNKYKEYGELINAYGYNLTPEDTQLSALNYYTNEHVTIPIDNHLTSSENAQKYFDKYNKSKRAYEALIKLIEETKQEVLHLESISASMDIALTENDLIQIKEELMQYGYIKRKHNTKKEKVKSKPFHYISSDGYHMYVGKNNYQNEELTFQVATGNDWWFHAKDIAGSHVIVKSNNEDLPDKTFEEAAKLAAFYSKGKSAPKVEIDYVQRKHVKKVNGGAPGFVIYHTNYSMTISPNISDIQQL